MPEVVSLPVRVEPASAESGFGYLLRAARANGLTLGSMFEGVGLPRALWMSEHGLAMLAHATETDFGWLRSHCVVAGCRDGHRFAEWRGQLWACPLSLRGARPQVCPICLREGRPCLLEWEMAGVAVCVRHRAVLIDSCVHCGRRLSWWRPAIDICSCGHFLSGEDEAVANDAVVGWTEMLLGKASRACVFANRFEFPRWLDVLSADGLLAVGFAFGIRREPLERVTSAAARVPPSSRDMAAVIERGVTRLRRAGELSDRCATDLRLHVYEEGLRRLWRRYADTADRDAAASLLLWLGALKPRSHRASHALVEGQRELFQRLVSDD